MTAPLSGIAAPRGAPPPRLDEGDLVREVIAGRYLDPTTGAPLASPIRLVRIAPSLDGGEADLVRAAGLVGRPTLVADADTWAALGRRVARRLEAAGGVDVVVLPRPKADEATAARLAERVRHADGLIAVGTGTINDLVKAVAYTSGREYVVFGSALSMNGYTTNTVSLFTAEGMKTTRPARPPIGVFLDLEVSAAAPLRLVRAGLGDSICRTTAEIDWLLSHHLFGTPFTDTPFRLQAEDEDDMLALADGYAARDLAAHAALARILVLTGVGALITGTTHSGSMSEHMVSHTIDMLAGAAHPGSLHGEQVGIATLAIARLQGEIFTAEQPPVLAETRLDEAEIVARFGRSGATCAEQFRAKRLDARAADAANARLERLWPSLRETFARRARPLVDLERAMAAAGAATRAADLALPGEAWTRALAHAREIRNRWTVLDLAAESGRLDAFVASEGR